MSTRIPHFVPTQLVALVGFIVFAVVSLVLLLFSVQQVPQTLGYGESGTTLYASSVPGTSEWYMNYSMEMGRRWPFVDSATRKITIYKNGSVVQPVDFNEVIQIVLDGKASTAAIEAEHFQFGNHHFDESEETEWLKIEQMLREHRLEEVSVDQVRRFLNVFHATTVALAITCLAAFCWLTMQFPAAQPLPAE